MAFRSWWWAALCLAVGCGARSTLELPEEGGSVSSGVGPSTSVTTSGAGGSDVPLVACTYALSGPPEVAIALPDRHAISAQVITTNGDPTQGPLEVAVEYIASGGNAQLHPENPITRIQLEPGSSSLTVGDTVLAGIESHSYGLMARSRDRIALAWYSDAGALEGIAVRTIDVASNALGNISPLEQGSFSVSDIVAGPSLVGGGLAGDGYAVAWRRPSVPNEPTTRAMAILDAEGAQVAGPFDVTPALDAPPGSALAWTGEHYLVAHAYGPECTPGEPLCVQDAVTILRFEPPTPGGEPLVAVAAIGVRPGATGRRPRMTHYRGRTFLLWEEVRTDVKELKLVELDPEGTPLSGARTLVELLVDDRWAAHASDQGLAVAYLQSSGDDGPPDQPGAALLNVLALDENGDLLDATAPIPVTLPQGGSPSIASLGGTPRSIAIAWSGRGSGGLDVSYLARLRCVDAGS